MLLIFCEGFGEDKNVVYVIDYEFVEEWSDRVINSLLEGCQRIRQPEGHDTVLKVPVASAKRGLLFVSLLNTNVGVHGW